MLVQVQKSINLVSPRARRICGVATCWLSPAAGILPPEAQSLVDMGSGAGFPALSWHPRRTERSPDRVRNIRKCVFLAEASRRCRPGSRAQSRHSSGATRGRRRPAGRYRDGTRPAPRGATSWSTPKPFLQADSICLFLKGARGGRGIDRSRETWRMSLEPIPACQGLPGTILRMKQVARAGLLTRLRAGETAPPPAFWP